MLGPGYGESILVHTGDGQWLVVDSCLGADGEPVALSYLREMDVDPATAVTMVVATHWHDDHVRGMAKLVSACVSARFCCAGALKTDEFLGVAGGLARRDHGEFGRGVREIHSVFTDLRRARRRPVWAAANRRLVNGDRCEVWSLSPDDAAFESFLRSVALLVSEPVGTSGPGSNKLRNELSVALWVRCGDAVCLLGADVEKRGWKAILGSRERPPQRASVFKVPHHGSRNADLPEVWNRLLTPEPFAILAPWRLGAGALPGTGDVERILSRTPHAYASAGFASGAVRRRGIVDKKLRGANVRIKREVGVPGMIRLRRSIGDGGPWRVELFGSACHLRELAA